MQTWRAHGDISGQTFLKAAFVESIVVEHPTTTGIHVIRVRMISGEQYFGYFSTREELTSFVNDWAGETVQIDLEPALQARAIEL